MKCADLPRRLFQVLSTASHRRPRRRHLALEGLETRLLMATDYYVATTVPIATPARSVNPSGRSRRG